MTELPTTSSYPLSQAGKGGHRKQGSIPPLSFPLPPALSAITSCRWLGESQPQKSEDVSSVMTANQSSYFCTILI